MSVAPSCNVPDTIKFSASIEYAPLPKSSYMAPCSDSGNQSVWITSGSGHVARSPELASSSAAPSLLLLLLLLLLELSLELSLLESSSSPPQAAAIMPNTARRASINFHFLRIFSLHVISEPVISRLAIQLSRVRRIVPIKRRKVCEHYVTSFGTLDMRK